MKEPVDHILRPHLPWRADGGITECGYNASKVQTITRDEYFARLKDLGRQRCALMTCMTCADTAQRWGTWDDDPRKAVEREVQWECRWGRSNDRGVRLRDELLALAALAEAHGDEFRAHIERLEQQRAWLDKKRELKSKPTPSRTRGGL
jgi:hypothetical protein